MRRSWATYRTAIGRTGNASREFADNRGVDKAADDAQLAGIVDNKFTQGIPVGQPDIVPKADAAGTGRVDDAFLDDGDGGDR